MLLSQPYRENRTLRPLSLAYLSLGRCSLFSPVIDRSTVIQRPSPLARPRSVYHFSGKVRRFRSNPLDFYVLVRARSDGPAGGKEWSQMMRLSEGAHKRDHSASPSGDRFGLWAEKTLASCERRDCVFTVPTVSVSRCAREMGNARTRCVSVARPHASVKFVMRFVFRSGGTRAASVLKALFIFLLPGFIFRGYR